MNIYLEGHATDKKGKVIGKPRLTNMRHSKCFANSFGLLLSEREDIAVNEDETDTETVVSRFVDTERVYCEICMEPVNVKDLQVHG